MVAAVAAQEKAEAAVLVDIEPILGPAAAALHQNLRYLCSPQPIIQSQLVRAAQAVPVRKIMEPTELTPFLPQLDPLAEDPAVTGTLDTKLDCPVDQVAVVDSETTTRQPEGLEFRAKVTTAELDSMPAQPAAVLVVVALVR